MEFVATWGTGDGQFIFPSGVAVDGAGNIYVADTNNHRIQVFRLAHVTGDVVAWGGRVAPEFKQKVVAISKRLQVSPDYLMAVMAFETGRTFDPAIRNYQSGATGLIQFLPSTAKALGTTTEALATMSSVEQLDYVEKYFQPYVGRMTSLEDLYMAVLWPAAVGRLANYVLFAQPSTAYDQNKGLDVNSDGQVTKEEASAKVVEQFGVGLEPENKG